MKTIVGITLGLGALVVAGIAYSSYRKKHPKIGAGMPNVETETINGVLKMSEVVSYFKTLALKKDRDIPFIAKYRRFESTFRIEPSKAKGLVLGVLNKETDELNPVKVIFADNFDEKIIEVMGNEDLVTLC